MLTDDHPALADALPWGTGLGRLLDRVAERLRARERVLVGVSGGVGSGKTTLAGALRDAVRDADHRVGAVSISTDHYLPDYTPDLPVHERDLPEHADIDLLHRNLTALLAGEPIDRPVWSFHTHRREGTERVLPPPRGIIVVEGIHALVDRVAEITGASAFVHTPSEIRRERFIARDRDGERGMAVEESARFFDEVADPTFLRLAPGYVERAEIVVLGDRMD